MIRQDRPAGETGRPGADSGQSSSSLESLDPLAQLLLELRPDLAVPIAESLVREALDNTADAILDVQWAQARARLYPDAIASGHSRHMLPYAVRRAREIATARLFRPGDRHGAVACRCSRCLPLDLGEAVA